MFFYGLLRVLAEQDEPVWTQLRFETAEENFRLAARHGLAAEQYWPEHGMIGSADLVLRTLLPLAAEGLARWGVSDAVSARYLDVIEQRCRTGINGSSWQVRTVAALEQGGADRDGAIKGMLARYLEGMAANQPVHTWPLRS
jgi:hypothetical protein